MTTGVNLLAIFAADISLMARPKHLLLLEDLKVEDLAAEGRSVARHEGMVVFVKQAVPGDVIDAQVVKRRKDFMEAVPVRFITCSGVRRDPFCRHFYECGGCNWQQLPYDVLSRFKQQQVHDALTRIGRIKNPLVLPILVPEQQLYYRNKLEFTFSANRWITPAEVRSGARITERRALGFHIPGRFDKVLDIDTCFLQPEPSNAIRNTVRELAIGMHLEFFDLIRHRGFLRNLIIRNNQKGEFMVIFSFFRDEPEQIMELLGETEKKFPQISSLLYVINPKPNDTISDLEIRLFSGKDYLEEEMEGLVYRISPKSFFQTNSPQACRLFGEVRKLADLTGGETVYDLYTGTGAIAVFLAKYCKKVIGIDYVPEAIADAEINARNNGMDNAFFLAGDIKGMLNPDLLEQYGAPDVMVADPPRTGMHPDVIRAIKDAGPSRIIYVSCNPATQARDLLRLSPEYRHVSSRPVDMFPFTHHVENISLLLKNP